MNPLALIVVGLIGLFAGIALTCFIILGYLRWWKW